MPLITNFNVNPYFDDFDEDKKFLRILFKPGYAVQARELTQIQSILQKQVERFGNNIFINGRFVYGGRTHAQNCISLKLDSTYNSSSIVASNFSGTTIYTPDLTKRAEVIVAVDADSNTGDPITLLVKQIYGDAFVAGETIKTFDSTNFATISSTLSNAVGVGQSFSIDEGVMYYSGYFLKTDPQSIAISKYDTSSASLKVGFDVYEYLVNAADDITLIDPAQEATNYQAPGADRYKVELILSTRTLDNVDDLANFIELVRFDSGKIQTSSKSTIYSKIGDEIAKRTFDESGNYVVVPFSITADANTTNQSMIDLSVGAGKAYVRGYEIEVSSQEKLTIPAARTTSSNVSFKISGEYGNYFLVTNSANNFSISKFSSIDLHCVNSSNTSTSSLIIANNTKIGTANVKSIDFVTASNTQNGYSYVYAVSLFNVNVSSLSANVQTGGDNINIKLGAGYSSANNAYTGGYLRIITGPGSGEPAKLITSYDGVSKNATVSPAFSTQPTSASIYSIEFNTRHIASLASTNSFGYISSSADISTQFGMDPYSTRTSDQRTILFDNNIEELVFKLPIPYPTSISSSNVSYQYVKQLSGVLTLGSTGSLPVDGTDIYGVGTSEQEIRNNYRFVCTAAGGSSYVVGQVIPSNAITVVNGGTTASNVVIAGGSGMSYDAYVTMTTTGNQRNKTYVGSNTTLAAITTTIALGGTDVNPGRIKVFTSNGQIHISQNAVVRTPETDQVLYLVDAIRLVKVLDFANNAINETNAGSATDVTSRYSLDTGQRDSYYDYSSIRLKAGQTPPIGPILVYVDRFTHSSGAGYFSVDSYPSQFYANSSTFVSSSGQFYRMRDCLDFRPSITEASLSKSWNNPATGSKIIKRGSTATVNYNYYLPRIDKLVLNSEGRFFVLSGVPAQNPVVPRNTDDSIALYEIRLPPYTNQAANLVFNLIPNKRYTMQDIGNLEKRIKSLEYYTTLSLLENDALSKSDPSLYGRSKNGIITDSFVNFNTVDGSSDDFNAGLFVDGAELRTSTIQKDFSLNYYANASSGIVKNRSLVFLSSNSNVFFAEQSFATDKISVNPYNVTSFVGGLKLVPQSDIWIDTNVLPDLIIDDAGNANMLQFITDMNKLQEINWGSWQNVGVATTVNNGWRTNTWSDDDYIYTQNFEKLKTSQNQTRTGTLISYSPQTVRTSLGEEIVNVETIPYIRSKEIIFTVNDYKPQAFTYPFIDNTSVLNITAKHNTFKFDVTATELKNLFSIYSSDNPSLSGCQVVISNSSTTIGTALVTHLSNNTMYVKNVILNDGFSVNWNSGLIKISPAKGPKTSLSYNLSTANAYTHSSGNVNTSISATTTSFRLSPDSFNASFYTSNTANVVGSTIRVVYGTGNTQSATITNYNPTTGVINFTPAFITTPTNTSIYQIGDLISDLSGKMAGSIYVKGGIFRTGERKFRLTDNQLGNFSESQSRAESSYFAQGTLQTKQEKILSTITPNKIITEKSENRVTTSYSEQYRYTEIERKDPVAETFYVDPFQHPDGIFLSKIRVCFGNKDDILPVTLQVRPTVNGYPSATQGHPFGEVSLMPSEVKANQLPSLDDSTKYTEFVFDSPVHLLPGEHSFVLLSNSNKYEVWTAKIGNNDVNTGGLVNTQPSTGSFFKSQNGSTWTAEQDTDMMFRIYYHQFDNTINGTATFEIDSTYFPTSSVYSDLMVLQSQEIIFGNTSLSYTFDSESSTTGLKTGYLPILPRKEYYMSDGYGRRVINPVTGNSTFRLKASLSTLNSDVSPILDLERYGIKAIEQRLNNLSLANSDMVVSNTGSYANGSNISITISGGGGTGATAIANVVSFIPGSNIIDKIVVTNGGSGYKTSPTITISGGLPQINAIASINGEDKKKGGNSFCRYITKRITLADGFNSGDLRVYLTAHKPAGSSIDVYYKLMAAGDLDNWQDREWQLMTQIDNVNYYSKNVDEFDELTFAPGVNNIANNSIVYNSSTSGQFNDFNTFAIKVVLSGVDTIDTPRVKDFRAIAIPAV